MANKLLKKIGIRKKTTKKLFLFENSFSTKHENRIISPPLTPINAALLWFIRELIRKMGIVEKIQTARNFHSLFLLSLIILVINTPVTINRIIKDKNLLEGKNIFENSVINLSR